MMQLTSKLWLDSDPHNWIVGERYLDGVKGIYRLNKCAYFSKMEAALDYTVENTLKDNLPETFKALVKLVKEIEGGSRQISIRNFDLQYFNQFA